MEMKHRIDHQTKGETTVNLPNRILNHILGLTTGECLLASEVIALKGCRFASFVYKAKASGEVAKHSVMLGVNYNKARRRDVSVLKGKLPSLQGLAREACEELIFSLDREGVSPFYTQEGTLSDLGRGLKVGIQSGVIYVHGFQRSKQVILEGEYKTVKSSAKTIAKNKLRKCMKTSKVRQYVLSNVQEARINGKTLEFT